jgi:ABC-type transporter Mla subunit MlaD
MGQLAGAVGPLIRLPLTVAHGLEPLLEQLGSVATRAVALLDDVEDIPQRIRALLANAEAITTGVDDVMVRADEAVARATAAIAAVEPAVKVLAALELSVLETLSPLIADLGAVLAGLRALDPALVDEGIDVVRALPDLITTFDATLLPALASLEGLVPVVAQLGAHVDHLDGTVVSLVAGIPGAARLLKRGNTPRQVPPNS